MKLCPFSNSLTSCIILFVLAMVNEEEIYIDELPLRT